MTCATCFCIVEVVWPDDLCLQTSDPHKAVLLVVVVGDPEVKAPESEANKYHKPLLVYPLLVAASCVAPS